MTVEPTLRTDRLILRPLAEGDSVVLFSYRSLPEVYRYQTWKPSELADAQAFIQDVRRHSFGTADTWFQFALCLRGSGKMIGDLGVHFLGSRNVEFEFGLTIEPKYQRRGYGSDAAAALLQYMFERHGKRRVVAHVDPANTSSMMLLEHSLRMRRVIRTGNVSTETDDSNLEYELFREEWESGI